MPCRLEPYDPAFSQLVPEGTVIDRVACGFAFTEGPLWMGNYLIFSDIRNNRIVRLRLAAEGPEITTYRHPSGNSNGHTLDRTGRLISCEHTGRRVSRTEPDGRVVALAETYGNCRFNSPNDVVVRSDNSVYFTDPPYGLTDHTKWKEQTCHGVYRVAPNGEISLLVSDFDRPNGLAFSPDERTLYIADTARYHLRAFDVAEDGGISNGRVFFEFKSPDQGGPDGMKVDVLGNIWSTGPGGLWVISPEGRDLGRIVFPDLPANCAWGDADWQTMYVTARPAIYRFRANVAGIPVP